MKRIVLFLLLVLPLSSWAVIETYDFDSELQREQFKRLVEELRCPKCQNQNLADSNSEIATDLRAEVFRLIDAGKTDQEIVAHLVARYGEFVRYKPPVNQYTFWLWFTPAILLVIGLMILIAVWRMQRSEPTAPLSDAEQAELRRLQEKSGK